MEFRDEITIDDVTLYFDFPVVAFDCTFKLYYYDSVMPLGFELTDNVPKLSHACLTCEFFEHLNLYFISLSNKTIATISRLDDSWQVLNTCSFVVDEPKYETYYSGDYVSIDMKKYWN